MNALATIAVPVITGIAVLAVMRAQISDLRVAVRELSASIKSLSHDRLAKVESSAVGFEAWRVQYTDRTIEWRDEIDRRLTAVETRSRS